jgi:hypothetical protein
MIRFAMAPKCGQLRAPEGRGWRLNRLVEGHLTPIGLNTLKFSSAATGGISPETDLRLTWAAML